MASFTPTSGIGWTHNSKYTAGTFAIGMETSPSGPDPGQATATAIHTENIPFSITSLTITGGTLTMQGNRKAAVLCRIGIGGDPKGGDAMGLGPGVAAFENDILNVAGEMPETIPIQPAVFNNIQHIIQVPPGGSPYRLIIFLQLAGAQWPMDAELEMNGEWTA